VTSTGSPIRRKWVLAASALTILLIGLLAGGCAFFRIHSKNDVMAYIGMWRECPPIWRDLAFRRIVEGDTVEHLSSLHPPVRQRVFGPFTLYSFEPPGRGTSYFGLNVVAQDGRLVLARAAGCTWRYDFFGDEGTVSAFYNAVTESLRPEEDR
jgi:hypothetical protein